MTPHLAFVHRLAVRSAPYLLSASLIALSLLIASGTSDRAHADAVMEVQCPPGALSKPSHSGGHCEPETCAGEGDCIGHGPRGTSYLCKPNIGLCVRERTLTDYNRHDGTETQRTVTAAKSACSSQADCDEGSTCEIAMRCMPPQVTDVFTPTNISKGCCSSPTSATPTPAGSLFFLGAMGLVFVSRRR